MKTFVSAGIILAVVLSVAVGQDRKAERDRLEEEIFSQLESRLPGWHHKRVEPFWPISTIVVQGWWPSPNRGVHVAVAIRESVEDAKKEIRSYLQFRREPQELTGFGDEAFIPEPNGSQLVLRRGRYVIYLSIFVDVDSDADARNLSQVEREERRKAEVQRIEKEFAKEILSIEAFNQ